MRPLKFVGIIVAAFISLMMIGGTQSALAAKPPAVQTGALSLDAPPAPELSQPKDGETVTSPPTFTWRNTSRAKDYQFQYAPVSDFSYGVFSSPWISARKYSPDSMPIGTSYWRVLARDKDENVSPPSEVRSVIIVGPTDPSDPTTFGLDGLVFTDGGTTGEILLAVAVQPDGRIVGAGGVYGSVGEAAIIRRNNDGSPDTTWGVDGQIITSSISIFRAVAVQSDGKIVAAGYIEDAEGNTTFAVARYNTDGSLDSTFGVAGIVTGPSMPIVYALAIQTDGKIVLAGIVYPASGGWDGVLLRLNGDGSFDTTFGGDGIVTFDNAGQLDRWDAVTLQSDGKIVAGGTTQLGGQVNVQIEIARYNTDGSLDTTFGSSGVVLDGWSPETYELKDIEIQPDGKVVIAGRSVQPGTSMDTSLMRLNSDGSLDLTFGTGGRVTTVVSTGVDAVYSLTLLPSGKILVNGSGLISGVGWTAYTVRYTASGSLDNKYGVGGIAVTNPIAPYTIGFSTSDSALLPNGDVVIAGSANKEGDSDFLLIRVSQ